MAKKNIDMPFTRRKEVVSVVMTIYISHIKNGLHQKKVNNQKLIDTSSLFSYIFPHFLYWDMLYLQSFAITLFQYHTPPTSLFLIYFFVHLKLDYHHVLTTRMLCLCPFFATTNRNKT